MLITYVFLFAFFTKVLTTSSGAANLIGFYTKFRKLCWCRCGISQNQIYGIQDHKLLEGGRYSPDQMPWLAMLYTTNFTFKATLISDRHVITAATPLYGLPPNHITVTLGIHEKCIQNHSLNTTIEAILLHPGYSPTTRINDIALLRLRHTVQFSQYIGPICMPLYDTFETGSLAWTTVTELQCQVRTVPVPILSSQSCFVSSTVSNNSQITQDKGCIGPLGSKSIICQTDIGGPVMTRWMPGLPFRLAGVVTSASCQKDETPLFTKTVDNLLWIHEHIRDDCQCF